MLVLGKGRSHGWRWTSDGLNEKNRKGSSFYVFVRYWLIDVNDVES